MYVRKAFFCTICSERPQQKNTVVQSEFWSIPASIASKQKKTRKIKNIFASHGENILELSDINPIHFKFYFVRRILCWNFFSSFFYLYVCFDYIFGSVSTFPADLNKSKQFVRIVNSKYANRKMPCVLPK